MALLTCVLGLTAGQSPAQAQTTVTCLPVGVFGVLNNAVVQYNNTTGNCTVLNNSNAINLGLNILTILLSVTADEGGFIGTGGGFSDSAHDGCTLGSFTAAAGAGCTNNRTTVGGETATLVKILPDGTRVEMTVSYTVAVGGGVLTFNSASVTVTPPSTQDKSSTIAGLQNTFNSATPGVLDTINGAGNGGGNGSGLAFAPTGLSFSQSHLDSANPMDREYGFLSAPNGYFAAGRKQRSGNGFNFSVDLNALANSAANDNLPGVTAYGTHGSKDAVPRPRSRITSFIKGEYVDFDDGETNADHDGHLWVVTSGVGLRVSPDTTIGILSRYRTGEAESNALAATLDSDFWGGGAFLTTTLGGGLKLALAGLYESGDNDIRIGADTGSFDSEHVTVEGRVAKRLERGNWWFEPGVGLRYVNTQQDNYTDSSGTFVTNQDLTLGRLTYGPTIGTTIHRGDTALRPFVKVNGVWDFENDGSFATATAGTFTSADSGLNLGGGIEVTYLSGLSIRLAGDWFTYDTDLEVWSISGGIGAPLSVLGLGQISLVSLDLAANAEEANATARLRIPLGGAE